MRALLLAVICAAMAVFILSSATVYAVDPPENKTVLVEVTVQEYAEITVLPTLLNWSTVNVGTPAGNKSLTVTNTGTVNVSNIYVYVDTLTDETTRPYGIDDPQKYAAGSVITMINQTGADKFYFVGRLEWNWTEDLPNKDLTNLTYPVAFGFFKNNSKEYFWSAGANSSGDEGACNQTDAEFALEDDNDIGVTATRSPSTAEIVHDGNDQNFGYFSVNRATSPLKGYCVAVNRTCNKIYIYKYDKRAGYSNCANSRYIRDANMVPGAIEHLTVDVYPPRGLPAGTLKQATMTFAASA